MKRENYGSGRRSGRDGDQNRRNRRNGDPQTQHPESSIRSCSHESEGLSGQDRPTQYDTETLTENMSSSESIENTSGGQSPKTPEASQREIQTPKAPEQSRQPDPENVPDLDPPLPPTENPESGGH